MTPPTLDDLRRHAVVRSLFAPTTLPRAIERLGFVQADPIRAPARAQDLTLRHRVRDYRAGDLERRYPTLAVEEDFFVNYGFVPRALLHRYNADSRDAGTAERMAIINGENGVWGCTLVSYCSEVCPKHVDPARAINQNKINSTKDYFLRFISPRGADKG